MSARLKAPPPRLATMAPLVPHRDFAERARLKERDQTIDWRGWYKTARWQALREQAMVRDLYMCQQTGIILAGKHPAPNSPVVDHIRPHGGDPDLFWDLDNLQTVSKQWHDSRKQAIEKADRVAAIHPKWLSRSIVPLTIVCGPPASGKSTYVGERAAPDDLVIDLDCIASQISGEPPHGWDRGRWLNAALYRRNDMLGSLSRPSKFSAAWFIVDEPKARHRDWWDQVLGPKQIVVIEADERQCLANAAKDEGRDLDRVEMIATRWWVDYDPRIGDTRIEWPWQP